MLSVDEYDERMGEILRAKWQEYATQESAERVREKIEEICQAIWAETSFNQHQLFQSGMQTGSAEFVGGKR